jgi:DNA-binding transcriptional ArsR family regulator
MVVRFDADRVFQALADPTRRDIVDRVLIREHSVTELARHYPMSFAAVQKHVTVLHRARLVDKRPAGREQLVSAHIDTVRRAAAVFERWDQLWRGRVERMHHLIDTTTPTKEPS